MKELHVANSPLSNNIYVGSVLKSGLWAANKQDVTIECLVAVAQHAINFGKPVIITDANKKPEYKITVEKF